MASAPGGLGPSRRHEQVHHPSHHRQPANKPEGVEPRRFARSFPHIESHARRDRPVSRRIHAGYSVCGRQDVNPFLAARRTIAQSTVAECPSGVIAASAGKEHSLALKSDGTVLAWGTGLTNYPNDFADEGQSMVPPGLSNVMVCMI